MENSMSTNRSTRISTRPSDPSAKQSAVNQAIGAKTAPHSALATTACPAQSTLL